MLNPKPVHLTPPAVMQAQGWIAEARDADGHLITAISPDTDDKTLGEFMRECVADGLIVTAFPE